MENNKTYYMLRDTSYKKVLSKPISVDLIMKQRRLPPTRYALFYELLPWEAFSAEVSVCGGLTIDWTSQIKR